jgi:GAF domain-containing protein
MSALTGLLDRDEVAKVVVDQSLAAGAADAVALHVFDERSNTFSLSAAQGWPEELAAQFGIVALDADLPMTDAVQRRELIFIGSRREATDRYPHLADVLEQNGTEALAVAPLFGPDHLLAVLALGYFSEQAFSPQERALLAAVGRRCAQALEGARLHQAEAAARDRADHLLRIAEVAHAASTLDDLLSAMLDPLRDLTGADPQSSSSGTRVATWPSARHWA